MLLIGWPGVIQRPSLTHASQDCLGTFHRICQEEEELGGQKGGGFMDPVWTEHPSLLLTFHWFNPIVACNYSSSHTSLQMAIYFPK